MTYLLNIRKSGVHTCLPVAVNEAIPPYKTGSHTKYSSVHVYNIKFIIEQKSQNI